MTTTTFKPGSFGMRAAATIIDQLIFGIALSPLLTLIFGKKTYTEEQLMHILHAEGLLGIFTPAELLISQALVLTITVILWVKFGGTPGKRLLGLRVVDAETGQNLTPMQSALRYVAYFVSSLPLFLGFLWALFDEKNQTWHDKIAKTIVIEEKNRRKRHSDRDSMIDQENHKIDKKDETFTA